MTREHVFPAWLYRETPEYEAQLLRRGDLREVPAELKVKDVCEACNCGALSSLDAAGKDLWPTFSRTIEAGESITLECESKTLKRWLLKLSYNSSRTQEDDADAVLLSSFSPYILGTGPTGRRAELLCRTVAPHVFDTREREVLKDMVELMRIGKINATQQRFSRVSLRREVAGVGAVRMVQLNSLLFYLVLSHVPQPDRAAWRRAIKSVQKEFAGSVVVDDGRNVLPPPSIDILELNAIAVAADFEQYQRIYSKR
jgi:hypothetical protein